MDAAKTLLNTTLVAAAIITLLFVVLVRGHKRPGRHGSTRFRHDDSLVFLLGGSLPFNPADISL
eukprot:scaffold5848_cov66-Cylindrotheca_fusiformis.AAC.2